VDWLPTTTLPDDPNEVEIWAAKSGTAAPSSIPKK